MCRFVHMRVVVAAVVMLQVGAFAQEGEVETTRMTVHPASPPVPALRYTFRPDIVQETPGNAAALYKEVAAQIGDLPEEVDEWRTLPPDQLPVEKVRALLDEYLPPERWEKLVAASLCREVDWETGYREEGIFAGAEHLNNLQSVVMLVTLRAQLELTDGDAASAVKSLTVGFELARDLQTEPLLLDALVAIRLNRLLLSQLRAVQQVDGSPNLYWALSDLPKPLIDVYKAQRMERAAVEIAFPVLRRIRSGEYTPEDYQELIVRAARYRGVAPAVDDGLQPAHKSTVIASGVTSIIKARAFLLAQGWTEEQLADLPAYKILAQYQILSYDIFWDDAWKWLLRSPGQVRRHTFQSPKPMPLPEQEMALLLLIPTPRRTMMQAIELDRKLAAMQIVEGLRAFAAANDGRLPDALEAMTETPAPIDPSTGEAFAYRVDGRTAVIVSPALASGGGKGLRYEVTIASD